MLRYNQLEKIFVRCAADFMTGQQNLHYKIASQHKLNSEKEYTLNSAQIKLELSVEKKTKEEEAFYAPQEKH